MTTCPNCRGLGFSIMFLDGYKDGRRHGWQEKRGCKTCLGTGQVSDEYAAELAVKQAAGKALRDARVRLHISLREAAEWLWKTKKISVPFGKSVAGVDLGAMGLDAVTLSKIERGDMVPPDGLTPEIYSEYRDERHDPLR